MAASKKAKHRKAAATKSSSAPWRVIRLVILLLVLVGLLFAIRPARYRWSLLAGTEALSDEAPQAALQEFEAARELYPENPEVHFWLARTWRKLGDFEKLRFHLDEARRLGFVNQNPAAV